MRMAASRPTLRCVWSFQGRSPGKDWRFPFKLSKNGTNTPNASYLREVLADGQPDRDQLLAVQRPCTAGVSEQDAKLAQNCWANFSRL
jgi:hypothetical protein